MISALPSNMMGFRSIASTFRAWPAAAMVIQNIRNLHMKLWTDIVGGSYSTLKSQKSTFQPLSDIQIKLKRIVGAVDSEPIVMNAKSNFKQKPWSAIVRQLLAAIHGNFATVSLFEVGRV